MATITFLAGASTPVGLPAGSGLGFYGAGGFGSSVAVGSYQDNTYITSSAGTALGPVAHQMKYIPSDGGGDSGNNGTIDINLLFIPNGEATLNIRFEHNTNIKTQNAEMRIYDRTTTTVGASGVTTKAAEIIHPNTNQIAGGSGDSTWITPVGSTTPVPLVAAPGVGGESPQGANTYAMQHDWYVVLSASPDSVGSKTLYGLWMTLEYL